MKDRLQPMMDALWLACWFGVARCVLSVIRFAEWTRLYRPKEISKVEKEYLAFRPRRIKAWLKKLGNQDSS